MRKTSLDMVYELAKKDERIVFIGSDLGAGTLDRFKLEMPERFFMEGVSEANILGMATGLAMEGKIPYANTIATFFSRRAYEQIVLDLCLHKAKVRLIASGGGLVYAPLGPTHLAIEDLSVLRAVPNLTIIAPCDANEMQHLMPLTVDYPGPIYIRLAKGGDPIVSQKDVPYEIGKAVLLKSGDDALFITTGICAQIALEAAHELGKEGLSVSVLHVHTVKPLDMAGILQQIRCVPLIVTVEEGVSSGGLGGAVAEIIADAGFSPAKRFVRVGIPDTFPSQYGSQASLLKYYGISKEHLMATVVSMSTSSKWQVIEKG